MIFSENLWCDFANRKEFFSMVDYQLLIVNDG